MIWTCEHCGHQDFVVPPNGFAERGWYCEKCGKLNVAYVGWKKMEI